MGFVLAMLLGAPALADQSVAGEALMQKCKICHTLDKAGANRVGPNLHGMFARKAGSTPGFTYSDAMKRSDVVWDDETLAKFLREPKEFMRGNRMSFPGVQDETALRDLIGQLKQATQ